MKRLLLILLITLGFNLSAQTSSLTIVEHTTKVELDTKVEVSENYMKVSGYTTVVSLGITIVAPNFVSGGAALVGMFTTPYHIIRHLIYVKKRNRFYKKHNILY